MATIPDHNKPVSIRLGELKPLLQREATSKDRSLHYLCKKVLREHCEAAGLIRKKK